MRQGWCHLHKDLETPSICVDEVKLYRTPFVFFSYTLVYFLSTSYTWFTFSPLLKLLSIVIVQLMFNCFENYINNSLLLNQHMQQYIITFKHRMR